MTEIIGLNKPKKDEISQIKDFLRELTPFIKKKSENPQALEGGKYYKKILTQIAELNLLFEKGAPEESKREPLRVYLTALYEIYTTKYAGVSKEVFEKITGELFNTAVTCFENEPSTEN
jgi:hypothetical protein